MLSHMTTHLGLTVMGPDGQPLRLLATSPAYRAGMDLLSRGLPDEQLWVQLKELVSSPLKALVSWCERFGARLSEDQDTLTLDGMSLSRQHWLPFLSRLEAVSGSPQVAVRLAKMLGDSAAKADIGQACLHVDWNPEAPMRLLRLEKLAAEALPGDVVLGTATEGDWFLVSYGAFHADQETGALNYSLGKVLQRVEDGADGLAKATDILAQPCVLGLNRTYQCEMGSAEGWLFEDSFDSLAAARKNAADLVKAGDEVRIVNRISRDTVRLH